MNRTIKRHNQTSNLARLSRTFFMQYGTFKLMGRRFTESIRAFEKSGGRDRFDALLAACGYQSDAAGFFETLLEGMHASPEQPLSVNGIEIPRLYLYFLLEQLMPGNRLHRIKTVSQLKDLGFKPPPDPDRLQEVIDRYPVRLSDHVIRQSQVSGAVKHQYLPFEAELDSIGETITFDGHFKNGLLEQMYENRVIFLLDMHCPVYCRFCFRKHKSSRNEPVPGISDVKKALAHVAAHGSIQEILITGGEPLLNRSCLEASVKGLMKIGHVNTIRIATRSMAYYPELFLKNDQKYLRDLIQWNRECTAKKKRIEVGIHMVHPDEISLPTLECISCLVKNGVQVYVQTPFIGHVNEKGKDLARLFVMLRQAGVQIYYIFTPCHTIHGTRTYWTPISRSLDAMDHLRQTVSDRCIPKLCTATALGKMEWHTSGWAVEKDSRDPDFTWIRTPYTKAYFQPFVQARSIPEHRENSEGTLDARFQLDMGRADLYHGSREHLERQMLPSKTCAEKPDSPVPERAALMEILYTGHNRPSGFPEPLPGVYQTHPVRLDVDWPVNGDLFSCVQEKREITDIVMHWDTVSEPDLMKILKMAERLKTLDHLVCLRVRSKCLGLFPERFTREMIEALTALADFSVADPFMVEMEVWFLTADQVSASHSSAAGRLLDQGINVYANVPLIRGVNDHPDEICRLALALRKAKIEFHHLYTGGLPVQVKAQTQIDPGRVIDIASDVRIRCSGRQIPLYMVQTASGEKEFGWNGGKPSE